MAAKTTDWRPGPTVCRCCLSEGCYKDISTEYFWMGKREVYSEMLLSAFNLTISYSQSGGPNSNSRLICEPCISRLRDASDFKRQVQECEKTFMQYIDPGMSSIGDAEVPEEQLETQVKVEQVKEEKMASDDDFDDRGGFDDDDDDDLDDQPLTKLASKVPKKESVDLLDLLDNAKAAVKRKSTTKTKVVPAKKSKTTKKEVKPTSSSKTLKIEKMKKGDTMVRTCIQIRPNELTASRAPSTRLSVPIRPIGIMRIGDSRPSILQTINKRHSIRESAISIIVNANVCPFKFNRFFMCLYCKYQCLTMSELMRHIHSEHYNMDRFHVRRAMVGTGRIQSTKINIIDYTCRICNQDLFNFEDLKRHLVENHKKVIDLENDGVVPFKITENSYVCGRCDEECGNYRLLTRHMNKHFSNFICDQCGSGFPTETRLKIHAVSHENGSFSCEMCDKVYRTNSAKQNHIEITHLHAKKNKCTLCPEKFRDYYRKQKHMVTVHGLERITYKCGFCPKTFLTSSNLRAHERLAHVKIHKYSCDHCSYHTYDKYALTMHLICHSDEKNFKCQVCKKSYARRKTLTEHMKIHNNDRRFACQYCDRAFVQKCSLKGHMKTHHREVQNFEC